MVAKTIDAVTPFSCHCEATYAVRMPIPTANSSAMRGRPEKPRFGGSIDEKGMRIPPLQNILPIRGGRVDALNTHRPPTPGEDLARFKRAFDHFQRLVEQSAQAFAVRLE
jgi:hypothetical protein